MLLFLDGPNDNFKVVSGARLVNYYPMKLLISKVERGGRDAKDHGVSRTSIDVSRSSEILRTIFGTILVLPE